MLLLIHRFLKQIVIEDSTNGVRAAKAAGIYCVEYNSIPNRKIYQRRMLLLIIFAELDFLHLFNPN
jgi:beta-phosphoglucomutase-like phosphatase (HAD superfamily)